ncbi:hypothetical protein M440DRAFT_1461367 [Trichoderma longibrachiatum ATCC 18648]|uniref:Uncharacterized protein n=1 Tax=Trichoderma longibrachiatum ATCC 18648 TaxID=983965 RepID=A0A2T4C993_TRILO|nr:hypothetical protein M440DRAFT_1461367 [Trichoderma longibrachiatum ATCC 18648]
MHQDVRRGRGIMPWGWTEGRPIDASNPGCLWQASQGSMRHEGLLQLTPFADHIRINRRIAATRRVIISGLMIAKVAAAVAVPLQPASQIYIHLDITRPVLADPICKQCFRTRGSKGTPAGSLVALGNSTLLGTAAPADLILQVSLSARRGLLVGAGLIKLIVVILRASSPVSKNGRVEN